MKKFIFLAIVLLAIPSFGYTQNMTFDDGTTWNCDQNFTPVAIRYQYQYRFYDTWNNPATVPAFMNKYAVRYKDSKYIRPGQAWPDGNNVSWTNQLIQSGYTVPASSSMEILSTFNSDWAVLNHPVVRTGNDFTIGYQIDYDYSNNFPDASDDIQHVECQPYYVTWCGDGVVDPGYETCDPAAPGQSPYTCDAVTCQPIVQQPTCDKIRVYPASGDVPLDVDVSCDTTNETSVSIACGNGQTINGKTGTCNYATVGTFYPVCTVNNSITSPTCQTTVKVRKPAPDISIKKYAKEISASGDTQTAPIAVARGEYFNYYYQLQNTGSIAATYVVVKDTLPAYLTFSGQVTIRNPAGADVTADWACTQGSQVFTGETIARITLVCIKATPLPANSGLYTFTVPVVLAANAPVAVNMQNVVYVCADNMVGNPTGPKGEVICGNLNPPPPPPPNQCTPTNNPQKDPACIVTTGSGPDLSIKKYAKEISASGDTQSAPISIARGEAFNYYYTLTVASNQSSTFVDNVVVKDTLPEYVTFNGSIKIQDGLVGCSTASGCSDVTSEWNCEKGIYPGTSRPTLICIHSGAVVPEFYDPVTGKIVRKYTFTVPVILASTAPVNINMQNVVYVCADNMVGNPTGPNGEVICGNLNPPPPPPPNQCTPTNNPQKDPACIVVPPPICTVNCGGGGGSSHVGPKCINSVKSCAIYNSLIACEAELGVGNCDSSDAPGQARCAAKTLVCSGPGGPTPGGLGNPGGRCGDGVLGSSPGEECDVVGAPWCGQPGTVDACKVKLDTTPGANSITDLWMTIPVLAGTQRLGYTWLDGTPGKVAFSDNRMVLGVGTKAFTLADSVGFGIKTQFRIPLIIEANKKICLKSEGSALNSQEICTTFGAGAPDSMIWTRIDGIRYVVIGQGDFQSRKGDGTYERMVANSPNNITLFKGATPYRPGLAATTVGPTLNSAFFGMTTGNNSTIGLFTDTGVDLVKLAVRVSSAVVSSIGSASNRAIESFINTRDVFSDFLGTTIGYTSTTNSNNTNTTTRVALPTLVGKTGGTVLTVAELEQRYAVNGNKNILAVTGDLTIACPAGSTVFTMNGVRTVIVTGNLIIRCNIVYGSSDSSPSWAWIAKNGNIQVFNGTGILNVGAVTNLAGVYVAVKDVGSTTGGDITYVGNTTTQAILRIEGTLYGNASPLFASRLYARATGAYDILTTGTILTYSNRALISPPPLLSQYLGTYQVQRVVQ